MESLSDLFAALPTTKKANPTAPTPAQAFNFLSGSLVVKTIGAYGGLNEGYVAENTPLPCENIHDLIASLGKKIQLSSAARDAIIIMMASAISLEVSGPFLWTHIAGPSSSLKTTILSLLGTAQDRVFSTTEFSSFYSGSTTGGKDNSLLPQLQNKVFIIKDLTPLLQSKADTQNVLFGQMRAIYDGTGEKFFNNGVHHNFQNVRFVCLTGVTNEIYKFQRTDMGERFLICDIMSDWTDEGRLIKLDTNLEAEGNAYDSIFGLIANGLSENEAPKIDHLKEEGRMCWGLFNHLLEYMQDESCGLRNLAQAFLADRTVKSTFDALAVWMEHARCRLAPKGQEFYRATPAEPHRSIKILSKYAMCIAIVTKSNAITEEVLRLARKLAFDSAKSFSLEIMNFIATYPLTSKNLLASKMKISATYVSTHCKHLVSIGVLEERYGATATEGPGHPSLCYVLSDKFREVANLIGLKEKSLAGKKHVPVTTAAEATSLEGLLQSVSYVPKSFGRAS